MVLRVPYNYNKKIFFNYLFIVYSHPHLYFQKFLNFYMTNIKEHLMLKTTVCT